MQLTRPLLLHAGIDSAAETRASLWDAMDSEMPPQVLICSCSKAPPPYSMPARHARSYSS